MKAPAAKTTTKRPLDRSARVRSLGEGRRTSGQYVLYWMTSARRLGWNFGLDHAIALAQEQERPLVVLEALRAGYPWASDRLHAFVLDGMRDHLAASDGTAVTYLPYVEPEPGAGSGLLQALAAEASVVVADEYPTFFLRRMVEAAGTKVDCRFDVVDGNGLVPLSLPGKSFLTAFSYRRWVQSHLDEFIHDRPSAAPLKRLDLPPAKVPREVLRRWIDPARKLLAEGDAALARLPIDHSVPRSPIPGGPVAAAKAAAEFVKHRLGRYDEDRNHPDRHGASGLSPYLHFGHLSAHALFWKVMEAEGWSPEKSRPAAGKREGFWKVSAPAEAFLDQLVVWRELGFHFAHHRADHAEYGSLPTWAQRTLEKHAKDPRPQLYSLEQLERSETADPLWNAAQRQLVQDGILHNYLRMLWGKRVLEWSATPQEALERLIHLNNKYALDGRDPNSYSGIFWIFGRFDRPWGPERPIFGTVRYMSSKNTAKKVRVREYLDRYEG